MWAHEAWDLPDPPDFVTFSKKAQVGGYYYKVRRRKLRFGTMSVRR